MTTELSYYKARQANRHPGTTPGFPLSRSKIKKTNRHRWLIEVSELHPLTTLLGAVYRPLKLSGNIDVVNVSTWVVLHRFFFYFVAYSSGSECPGRSAEA